MDQAEQKRAAARAALDWVEPGMRLGLGTGSTAAAFVEALGGRVAGGLDVLGVPTSVATRDQAAGLGIPLSTLDETPELDLCIDGADELDPDLNLIKGGGGALTREKIVAQAASRMLVIADQSKAVDRLGRFPLPIEILPFGAGSTIRSIAATLARHGMNASPRFRETEGERYVTDNGNWIVDCCCDLIPDPEGLARDLLPIAGVVEHGLFIGLCHAAIIASPSGIETRKPRQLAEIAV